ncbi:MAG TPA: hypothetical protein VIL83_10385 [Capillibacterium sp.]
MRKSRLQRTLLYFLIAGMVFGVGLPAAGATPWSGTASYSTQGQAQFQVGYQVNDRLALGFGYGELTGNVLTGNRWLSEFRWTPKETMALQAGYDLTGNHYFLGGQAQLPLNQNLTFVSGLKTVLPAQGSSKYVDYRLGLQIGIGYHHYLFAGGQGQFQTGVEHEPELFVELDLNWSFPQNWAVRFEPHVGVEGDFSHKTTVTKGWANEMETGLFVGQDAQGHWDVGLFVSY